MAAAYAASSSSAKLTIAFALGKNHAMLTAESIVANGCAPSGWVANRLPPGAEYADENINALKSRLSLQFLGEVPVMERIEPGRVAEYLSLPS